MVPELAGLPAPVINEPHLADPEQRATAGVILDKTYPTRIVAHQEARVGALETYKRALE